MTKIFNRIFSSLFIMFWLIVTLANAFTPSKDFSENENKYLIKFPKFSFEGIVEGDYMKEVETYLNEQFLFRDKWISTQSKIEILMGKREINGVYLGKDKYLFNKFTDNSYSKSYINSMFSMIKDFTAKQDLPISVMPIPTSGIILRDKLPLNAPYYNSDLLYDLAKTFFAEDLIDLRKTFDEEKNNEQLFYRTDHHYTTNGAYIAYREYCKHNGIAPKEKEFFDIQTVSTDFYGTLHSKVLDNSLPKDSVSIPKNMPKVNIIYDGQKSDNTPYKLENLSKKDKYAVFFGGNYGTVEISTENENGKILLVFKDSSANSFVPFLLHDYEKIIMVDLRYSKKESVEIIKRDEISEILFLYEFSNLITDKHIVNLEQYKDSIIASE